MGVLEPVEHTPSHHSHESPPPHLDITDDVAGPEVVDHGITGYIVESEEEALAAIAQIGVLDRHRIRATFERRFTANRMARRYLDVYSRLLRQPEELAAAS